MFSSLRISALAAVVVSLAACTFELPPIASASLSRYEAGAPVSNRSLSPSQSRVLETWFAERASGWSASYASYAPSLQVRVAHKNGQESVANLVGHKVIVYGSFGQYEQQFSAESIAKLRSLIRANDD